MRMNMFKNKKQATNWVFSYLVIILSLFIMMAVIVSVYSVSLKKETNEFNEFVFESVAASVNDVLLSVNDLHLSLSRNKNLDKFLGLNGNHHKSQITYDLVEDLKSYRQFAANIDYFFVYLKEYDLVLSENGVSNSFDYYNYYFDTKVISFDEWKNLFHSFKNDRYISLSCTNNLNEQIDSLGFMFQADLDNPDAVGMILCDKRHFTKNIEKLGWKYPSDIYIYNSEGNLVLQYKNSKDEKVPQTLKEVEKFDNNQNIVFKKSISSDRYFWQIITITSKNMLNAEIYMIQSFVIGIIIFSVVMLFFLVKYFLKLNKKPLKSALSLFGVYEDKDEYHVLYKLINETLDRNNNLLKDVEARDRELKTVAISKIIRGDLPHSSFAEYDIEFNWELYCVLSFYIEDISALFSDDENMPDFERLYHLRYIINNVMEELFLEAGFKIYTTEIERYVVCLASLADGTTVDMVMELVQRGVSYINMYFNIDLHYATSSIYDTFFDLTKAYVQTKEIFENKHIDSISQNSSLPKKKKHLKCSVDDIVKYVHDNLTDCSLGVASIGDYFNITGSYASKMFKDSMHISLTDYIARMRIRLAQKLIAEGKYSIMEVSEMVGFNNDRAFYRAQKKFGKF